MSHMSEFIAEARELSSRYLGCSPEQALVYACEDIVDREIGSQAVSSHAVQQWVISVCTAEDLDPPHIVVQRATPTTLASASPDTNTICIRGRNTTHATLLHEISHVAGSAHQHDQQFRDRFIQLARSHISVQYAAMLHALYAGVGLSIAPWTSSIRQR
jgi:hypothetical protein